MQHKNWPHSVYTCSCCCGHPKHHPPYHWTTEPLHYTTHLTSPTVDCLEVLLGSCATHWIRVWFKTNQGGHVIVAAFVARSPVLHFEVQTFCNSFCIMPLKPSTHPHTTQSLLLPGPLNANTSFGHLKRKELSISAEMANQLWPRTPTKSPNCFGHKSCSVSVWTKVVFLAKFAPLKREMAKIGKIEWIYSHFKNATCIFCLTENTWIK